MQRDLVERAIAGDHGAFSEQITSSPDGSDYPGEPSPDGRLLLLAHGVGDEQATFVMNADGTQLRRLVPSSVTINGENAGSWSPDGETILFEARATPDSRFSI